MRVFVLTAALALAAPFGAMAQSRADTLADIRAQLTTLGGELSSLRSELMTTGAVSRPGGSTMLERMESMELELMRLTGRTEELELKVNRMVTDGTNRLGDLEFRVVELEGGDTGAIGQTAPLGGEKPAAAMPAAPVATGEKADFDRARGVLGQGDFRTAESLFAAHASTYPAGELTGEALFLRGEALEGLGEQAQAATSYLESFSGYPEGPRAAEALFRLGRALARLGQVYEGCLTMEQVSERYPGHPITAEAEATRAALSCQ